MERLGGFWWIVLPAWLWALLPLWAASGGILGIMELVGLLVLGVPIALAWIFAPVACCTGSKGRALVLWLSVPVVWLTAAVLSATDVPMIVRFGLSEPALRRYAEGDDPYPPHYTTGTRYIGLFHVHKVWRHGRMTAFATGSKPFVTAGVMYAPDGLPGALPMECEELLSARYTHISGPWYRFEFGD